jgi:hypothetical protein
MVSGLAQEQWFSVSAPTIINREGFPCINTDTDLSCRMIRILSGLCQDVDDQLPHSHSFVYAIGFRIVGLGNNGMEPLIVKIYEDRVHALQDAMHCAVMQVKEP